MAERVEKEASDSGLSTSFLTDSPRRSPEKGKFIGNVSSCVPLPEEYKGPVMKGHLIFDACYEGGLSSFIYIYIYSLSLSLSQVI